MFTPPWWTRGEKIKLLVHIWNAVSVLWPPKWSKEIKDSSPSGQTLIGRLTRLIELAKESKGVYKCLRQFPYNKVPFTLSRLTDCARGGTVVFPSTHYWRSMIVLKDARLFDSIKDGYGYKKETFICETCFSVCSTIKVVIKSEQRRMVLTKCEVRFSNFHISVKVVRLHPCSYPCVINTNSCVCHV